MKRLCEKLSAAAWSFALLLFSLSPVRAGSATWNLNPASSDWNTASNWTPATVPNGPADVATFGGSNTTTISLNQTDEVSGLVFNAGAPSYTLAIGPAALGKLTLSGAGITNNSVMPQTFIVQRYDEGAEGTLAFNGSATAGNNAVFIVQGGDSKVFSPASIQFNDNASAGNGQFFCQGAAAHGAGGGVSFFDNSTAATGIFTIDGSGSSRSEAGFVYLSDDTTAGDGAFIVNGTDVVGAAPGHLTFFDYASASNATLIANGGAEAGGLIRFEDLTTSGGTASVDLFGNGTLEITAFARPALTIGSLTGDGIVSLGNTSLNIGSNSLSTLFTGVIQGAGAITKIGGGQLTLGGANTYIGGTTVSAGALIATNSSGSATGPGPVAVNDSGTLGGSGIIAGPVTLNVGSFLRPEIGGGRQTTTTTQGALTFNSGSTYSYNFKAKGRKARTDNVVANGVTINGGATFSFSGSTKGLLTYGLVLPVITNTSANPISGTFSNLADGEVLLLGGNFFEAHYKGGDGNDLTLVVVPPPPRS